MEKDEHRERVVLIYFLFLITIVIHNMLKEVTILDVMYLIALVCAVIKYFLIMRSRRK